MVGFFQDAGVGVGGGGCLFQYQRLERRDDGAAPRSRWRWLPAALNGGKAASSSPPCSFHAKKLRWGRITSALIPRKVAELTAKIRHAAGAGAAAEADACPAVVIFMSPWGLPVLSRPLLAGHRSRCQYRHGRGAF